jgi:hypothetical protein
MQRISGAAAIDVAAIGRIASSPPHPQAGEGRGGGGEVRAVHQPRPRAEARRTHLRLPRALRVSERLTRRGGARIELRRRCGHHEPAAVRRPAGAEALCT